jgi:protein-tyrosine phosphatase
VILEEYVCNSYYGHRTVRWQVHPLIVIGGLINGPDDARHLQDNLGIRSVINVATDDTDEGKGIKLLSELRVPDDGTPLPPEMVRHAVAFAKMFVGFGPVYVHCALGNSRSPAFAYAILRWVFQQSRDEALRAIREGKPGITEQYGQNWVQANYLTSVESALNLP